MPTPKGGYYLGNERVPAVSTILSKFRDPGALMHWAAEEAKAGRDYRETRDHAANAGTLAHKMVECDWRKIPWVRNGEPDEIVEKAMNAFSAYQEWAEQTHLDIVAGEVPLVSKQFRFGGTFDALLIRGKRSMGDVKTSSAIYPEHLMQVAAYGALWDEAHPDEPIEGGFHILRFSKEECDFSHHYYSELDDAWAAFLCLRNAYSLVEKLKRRTG